ncbi:hypothetical protein [Nocardiopsis alba]|uniref:hypothetical protein n=1 Tax=Nocardiopsis alba TaxID=53437 RepID=UPI00059F5B24|nr:hypothetical protein [Nocardiopsis alba]
MQADDEGDPGDPGLGRETETADQSGPGEDQGELDEDDDAEEGAEPRFLRFGVGRGLCVLSGLSAGDEDDQDDDGRGHGHRENADPPDQGGG